MNAAEEKRIEKSFRAARKEKGAIVDIAHRTLVSLPPTDPGARALVKRIVESADPAAECLEWFENAMVDRHVG
jgi:hypothetical protein